METEPGVLGRCACTEYYVVPILGHVKLRCRNGEIPLLLVVGRGEEFLEISDRAHGSRFKENCPKLA